MEQNYYITLIFDQLTSPHFITYGHLYSNPTRLANKYSEEPSTGAAPLRPLFKIQLGLLYVFEPAESYLAGMPIFTENQVRGLRPCDLFLEVSLCPVREKMRDSTDALDEDGRSRVGKGNPMRLGWQTVVGGGIFGLVLAVGLGSLLPRRWALPEVTDCPVPIYLQGGAIHTDIILPRQNQYADWGKLLPSATIGAEASGYLSFGFGEQDFYMGEPGSLVKRWPDGLRALFWANPSIVFVNPVAQVPETAHCIGLTVDQYEQLIQHIITSFQRNAQGKLIPLGRGFQTTGQFFQGQQGYSLLFTCNHWTAQGLDRAGVSTPLFPLLTQSILWHSRGACACSRPPIPALGHP
ncbi:hypothetical protein GlitD10_1645 [Gloeomargarita lithophora Alchichica-D10]|uniref:DUF2459 domain-containing protein n=1 Tax=Gloeomargarita lithophora Alchichica-D10 TaxID=1188229 RepID=A0A1J0ADH2_9CYAN|nr:DUF2459 domain-containing protein [Gloeomargarita lithophora]APB33969.1 hypothetical protein GlitD10_1645 [Gloeomargarita lithophora Alchichica-D10]